MSRPGFIEKRLFVGPIRNVVDGNVTIPNRYLHEAGIGNSVEVIVVSDGILLRPTKNKCLFCGSGNGVKVLYQRYICVTCINNMIQQLKRRGTDGR